MALLVSYMHASHTPLASRLVQVRNVLGNPNPNPNLTLTLTQTLTLLHIPFLNQVLSHLMDEPL